MCAILIDREILNRFSCSSHDFRALRTIFVLFAIHRWLGNVYQSYSTFLYLLSVVFKLHVWILNGLIKGLFFGGILKIEILVSMDQKAITKWKVYLHILFES